MARKRSAEPELTFRCDVEDWSLDLTSGVHAGAPADVDSPFFEEVSLSVVGTSAPAFRGLDRIKINITGNHAGIRHRGGIGVMRMETDHLWSGVEVSPEHFALMLTAFASGKVTVIYIEAKPPNKRSAAPATMIVCATKQIDYLEPDPGQ